MPYLLIAPAIVSVILFRLVPLIMVGGLSLYSTNMIEWEYVGMDNFRAIFSDPERWAAIPNSLLYIVIIVPAAVGCSVGLVLIAKALSEREKHMVRLLIYIPALVTGLVMAGIWRWIFHYDGAINNLIRRLGGERISFFSTRMTAIVPISLIQIIGTMSVYVLLLMAAVKSVPDECYDAAKVEGAGEWACHRIVTLPMIRKTIGLVAVISTANALQIFDYVFMLAPYRYSTTLVYSLYSEAFLYGHFGIGSAYTVVLMIITSVLAVFQRRLTRW